MGLTAKKALGASKKYTDDQIAQIPGGTVVDVVEDGNMNPVTSNAVYDEAQEIKLSISNLSASVLHTSGNETAAGVKTFSSGINSSKGVIGPKASGESDPHVPLELRGSDTEAWALFSNRLGVGLGYFGSKSDNKPYFYNTEPHELAFKSQIPIVDSVPALNSGNAVSSGGVYDELQEIKPTVLNTIYEQKKFSYSDTCYRKTVAIELPDFNHLDFYIVKTWMKGSSGELSEYDHRLIKIDSGDLTSSAMSHSSNKVSIYTDSQTGKNMIQVDGTTEVIIRFYMEITAFIQLS